MVRFGSSLVLGAIHYLKSADRHQDERFCNTMVELAGKKTLMKDFPQLTFRLSISPITCTSNDLERINKEIRRTTQVDVVLANETSCLKLLTKLLMDIPHAPSQSV